jgi:hypothetical protein
MHGEFDDSKRDVYIWGPIESGCTYSWGETSDGIDAVLGSGCGNCPMSNQETKGAGDYAFNMGSDDQCRCPKIHFEAVATK